MREETTMRSRWRDARMACPLVLVLAACGASLVPASLVPATSPRVPATSPSLVPPVPPVGALAFGRASDEEIRVALYSFMRPADYSEEEYAMAIADSNASGGVCPVVERMPDRSIVGADGCVAPSGHTYAGRLEYIEAESLDYEVIFGAYSRIAADGSAYRYDGAILADVVDTETGVYQVKLAVDRPDAALSIDVSAACVTDDGYVCTFAPGSRVTIESLGSFRIEGSFRQTPAGETSGMLVYRGADTMRVDILPGWCMRYIIDGSAPRTMCPGGD